MPVLQCRLCYERKPVRLFSPASQLSFRYTRPEAVCEMTFPTQFTLASGLPGQFYFWPSAGAAVGIYLFCHGFFLLRRKRLIMNTPASKIRSAAMGLVEISGLATGPYTVTAPITGVACYYYRTLVWQWKQSGRSSAWVKECDESLHVPFYLEDETGRLLVNPQGAELDIHRDFHDEFSSTSFFPKDLEVPANIEKFLLMHGVSAGKKTRVEEYCIKPKNALFILGTLAENHGPEASATPVRSLQPRSISFSATMGPSMSGNKDITLGFLKPGSSRDPVPLYRPPHPLDPAQQAKVSAALMKAGISNPAAWAAAGVSQSAPVAPVAVTQTAAAAPATGFDLRPPTILTKGDNNPAFFISWRSQREVVSSLGWKSGLMIWGGPALTLVSVYLLAAMLGWL